MWNTQFSPLWVVNTHTHLAPTLFHYHLYPRVSVCCCLVPAANRPACVTLLTFILSCTWHIAPPLDSLTIIVIHLFYVRTIFVRLFIVCLFVMIQGPFSKGDTHTLRFSHRCMHACVCLRLLRGSRSGWQAITGRIFLHSKYVCVLYC
jgi:hypothetical protein